MSEKLCVEARAVMDLTSRENATYIDVLAAVTRMEAAVEERGRRAGIEERDELLGRARDWLQFMAAHPGEGDAKNLIARIDAALAPRDSGKGDDSYCSTCNSIRGTHQEWCTLAAAQEARK